MDPRHRTLKAMLQPVPGCHHHLVKVENLDEGIVSASSVKHLPATISAFFLTRRSLCSVAILVVKKVANSSAHKLSWPDHTTVAD